MENASKALLMAAGVLIGLLILSLAVYLFANFSSTSNQIHEKIEQDQINQFNAQFTIYQGRNDNTVYDILTVINLAKDNNNSKELMQNEVWNDYITVNVEAVGSGLERNSQEAQQTIDKFLKENLKEEELFKYTCGIEISELTQRVKKIKFKRIFD